MEFGERVGHYWRAFFQRLEERHHLDVRRPDHLWLLHTLFLAEINQDIQELVAEWNCHPVSGVNMLPQVRIIDCACQCLPFSLLWQDMMFLGETEHGAYSDELHGVHPDVIAQYHGTGNGHDGWDDVLDAADMTGNVNEGRCSQHRQPSYALIQHAVVAERLEEAQAGNVHQEPVHVPETNSPFASDADEQQFLSTVQQVQQAGHIPALFRLAVESGYPNYEYIRYGKKGTNELKIPLNHTLWYPRALLWSQALDVLSRLTD